MLCRWSSESACGATSPRPHWATREISGVSELSPRPSLPLTSSYAPAVTPGLWGCVLLYFYSFGLVLLCLPQSSVYGISSAYIHLELLDFSRVFRSMPSRHLWLRSDTPHHTFLCPRHYEWVWCRFPHLRQVGGVFWFVPCEYNGVATHSLLRWHRPFSLPSLP